MNDERELESLFRAERAVSPEPLALEHGLRRLRLDLAAQVVPPPIGSGPLELGISAVPKWLAGGFVVGLLGASATLPLFAPPSPMSREAPPAGLSAPPSVPAPALASSSTEPEAAAPSPQQDLPNPILPSVGAPATNGAPAAGSTAKASFDAELELISLAKSELDARRLARAQARLSEHAERFPHGVFAVEREALLALAACEQQPPNAILAKRFALAHPNSPLSERLERACDLNADTKSPNGSTPPRERMIEPNTGVER
jgi:hypothetical protein